VLLPQGAYARAPRGQVLACKPDALVINSFSKYYSMTGAPRPAPPRSARPTRRPARGHEAGWRLGWIVCKDASFRAGLEALLQSLFISAPSGAHPPWEIRGLRASEETRGSKVTPYSVRLGTP